MCCSFFSRPLLLALAGLGLILGIGQLVTDAANAESNQPASLAEQGEQAEQDMPDVPAALNFTVQSIAGDDVELARYHGDVLLIVNVASRCGLTGQYKPLQQLHEDYAEQGLSILGFPANNFGKQEPGSNDEIASFCEKNYGVEFDMFAKISVKGKDQAPLYRFLTSEKTNPKFAGDIRWNFDKFLVARDGTVIARFEPRTGPRSEEVVKAIEAALKQPVPDAVKAKKQAEDAE
ncbi:MAG: glutathione peroxidase [Phycisphaeraceae bacterium]